MDIRIGQKFTRDNNPELGVGVVTALDGRFFDVMFPDSGTSMRLTTEAPGVTFIELKVGDEVEHQGAVTTIARIVAEVATLETGAIANVRDLWPVVRPASVLDRIMKGAIDPMEDVQNRLDGYTLLNYRRRGAVPSLMGGRVEVFAHQLDTAARAVEDDPVRWLLADEVGLGKTVVACMITSALVRMGRIESAVILAPETLTVQWLGELYRKFHQVFVHIDLERVEAVRSDFGADVNPFDVHPLAILSFELLAARPELQAALAAAQPQMVVLDEAHRTMDAKLEDAILPVLAGAHHGLLLTATPFQHDDAGFRRLAEALRLPFEDVDGGVAFSHVSAVTRDDIAALGKRVPVPVDVSGTTLDDEDARVQWLVKEAKAWKAKGQKALVFVNNASRAKRLQETLERLLQTRIFVFHEQMKTSARDIELAQFRISPNPLLVSSGAGSEGRNFQFCDVLVHMDLPDDLMVLEQRIGRLDRIGRTGDIPIVYFRTPETAEFEASGVFERVTISAKRRPGWFFPDSHQKEDSGDVLRAIPADLESLTEKFCIEAAERLGMDIVEKDGSAIYFVEYGSHVTADAIPGIHEGDRFLGTFQRIEAVQNDVIDFFANGHALVEGLLAELEDSHRGRVAAIRLDHEQRRRLKGVYLLVLEGKQVAKMRFLPLMDASGLAAPLIQREGQRVLDLLTTAQPLAPTYAAALAERFKEHPRIVQLDPLEVVFAALVVAMDG